jgi:hypothetical protein
MILIDSDSALLHILYFIPCITHSQFKSGQHDDRRISFIDRDLQSAARHYFFIALEWERGSLGVWLRLQAGRVTNANT